MLELRAQTGPVFLTYRASPAIERRCRGDASRPRRSSISSRPTASGTRLARPTSASATLVAAFAAVPALYIADGHHRAASAARRASTAARSQAGAGEWDTVLAVAFPDDQMQILPYNRVVRDLAGQHRRVAPGGVERAAVAVTPGPASPARSGEVAMFLDGVWHTIALGDASRCARAGRSPRREPAAGHRAGAVAGHRRRPHRQAHRLRRRRAGHGGARNARQVGRGRRGVLDAIRSSVAT